MPVEVEEEEEIKVVEVQKQAEASGSCPWARPSSLEMLLHSSPARYDTLFVLLNCKYYVFVLIINIIQLRLEI
jgi:hypothetical protein